MTTTTKTQMFVGNHYSWAGESVRDYILHAMAKSGGFDRSECALAKRQMDWDGLAYGEPLYFRLTASIEGFVRNLDILRDIRPVN